MTSLFRKDIASIVAVGTEVTTGQIENKHAKFLSEAIDEIGFEVPLHIAVEDDLEKVMTVLEFVSQWADDIFVTGGLGPTTDDLTREAISKWCGLELEFSPEVWEFIAKRLSARGRERKPIHKKQAHFPVGCRILPNQVGTAHGFVVEKQVAKGRIIRVWAMPGPTAELKSIWDPLVVPELLKRIPENSVELLTWKIQGLGESEIAERVERITLGAEVRVGYRLYDGGVELKLWVPRTNRALLEPIIDEINKSFLSK